MIGFAVVLLLLCAFFCFFMLWLRNRDPLYLGLVFWLAAEIVANFPFNAIH